MCQNRTIVTSVEDVRDFSNFIEKDYILSQYLEHTLLAPQGKQIIEDANNALKRSENVAMRIYSTKIR